MQPLFISPQISRLFSFHTVCMQAQPYQGMEEEIAKQAAANLRHIQANRHKRDF